MLVPSPLIGSLAVFRQETTCPRDRHGAGSWDCTSGEYLAADAERVAGLRSGQRMRGEENKKGGETGIQMMASQLFRCQLKSPL